MTIDKPLCSFDDCKKYSDGNCIASESRRESCEFRIMAEKQTPKETETKGINIDGYWVVKCPECETVIEGMRYIANYCCKCGQALKWGE